MASPAQAEKNESPADSDDTDASDALEDETATDEDAEDESSEDADAEETTDEAAEAADKEPPAAKALKDMTHEELASALTPEQQMRIAHKFANKTMAAARRAEKSTGDVKATNEKLTGELATYRGFVQQFETNPLAALRRLPGFTTLKEFVQKCIDGGATAEPKPQDEIAALRKRIDDREANEKRDREANAARASQDRVFDALAKEPERFDLVLTRLGKAELWDAIVAYQNKNGRCPNDKVFLLADKVEEALSKDIASTKKFAGPAQKGNSAAAKAQAAASKTGKPAPKSTSTPAARANEPDEDEDERERRIIAEMREAGELNDD